MFEIRDNRVIRELKRARVPIQEFLDEIATHEHDEIIIFYNDESTGPFITYNTCSYRKYLAILKEELNKKALETIT